MALRVSGILGLIDFCFFFFFKFFVAVSIIEKQKKCLKMGKIYLQWTAHSFVVTIIAYSNVFPHFGRYIESPDFIGDGWVLYNTAIHVYLVAEKYARVSITRSGSSANDARCFPYVAVIIVNIDHLGLSEALASYDVEWILPDDRAMTGRAFGWKIVRHRLPVATFALLTAVWSWIIIRKEYVYPSSRSQPQAGQ